MKNVRNVRKAQITLFKAALLEAFDASLEGFNKKHRVPGAADVGFGSVVRVKGFGGIMLRMKRSRGYRIQQHPSTDVELFTFDGFPLRFGTWGYNQIEGGKSTLSSCAKDIYEFLFPERGDDAYQEWLESHEPLSTKDGAPSRVLVWL